MIKPLTPGQATREASETLGRAGLADVRSVRSGNLRTTPPQVLTEVRLMDWATDTLVRERADILRKLPGVREVTAINNRIAVYREPMTELRLTGLAVRVLADLGHLPGWPGEVRPGAVKADSPDFDLDSAAVRWYQGSTSQRYGRGTVQTGAVSVTGAALVLDYLESVACAQVAPDVDQADARREGRAIGRAVDQAAEHMRRAGFRVVEQPGTSPRYRIEV